MTEPLYTMLKVLHCQECVCGGYCQVSLKLLGSLWANFLPNELLVHRKPEGGLGPKLDKHEQLTFRLLAFDGVALC